MDEDWLYSKVTDDDTKTVAKALDEAPKYVNKKINKWHSGDVHNNYTLLQHAIHGFCGAEMLNLLIERGAKVDATCHQIVKEHHLSCTLTEPDSNGDYGYYSPEDQRGWWLEYMGKTYTDEWYKETKAILDKHSTSKKTSKTKPDAKKNAASVQDGTKKKADDDALTIEGIRAEAAALAVRQREAREAQEPAKTIN